MPEGNDYISKSYSALKDHIEGFNKSEDEYRKLVTTDPTYRDKVYSALKDNLEGFNKSKDEFSSNITSTPTQPQPKQPQVKTYSGDLSKTKLNSNGDFIKKGSLNDDLIKEPTKEEPKQKESKDFDFNKAFPAAKEPANFGDIATMKGTLRKESATGTVLQKNMEHRVTQKREAIVNMVKKKYKGIDESSKLFQNEQKNLAQKVQDGELVLTHDKEGKVALTKPAGFWLSGGTALVNSIKEPINNWQIAKASSEELPAVLKKIDAEKPDIPEYEATGLGNIGAELGGFVKPVALGAIPVAGEAALVGETYYNSYANNTVKLFKEGVAQGLSEIEAARRAKHTAPITAIGDAAVMLAMNRIGGEGISAEGQVAKDTFIDKIAEHISHANKVGLIASGNEIVKGGIEVLAGYDVKAKDVLNDAAQSYGHMALTDIAFNIGTGAIKDVTGKLKTAAKDYLSKAADKEDLATILENHPQKKELEEFVGTHENAKDKVSGLVPKEDESTHADLIQEKQKSTSEIDRLEKLKEGKDPSLTKVLDDEIDAHKENIQHIDKQMADMQQNGVPIDFMLDPTEDVPYPENEPVKEEEVKVSPENEIIDLKKRKSEIEHSLSADDAQFAENRQRILVKEARDRALSELKDINEKLASHENNKKNDTNKEIEVKKVDIEKRRKEELDNFNDPFNLNAKIEVRDENGKLISDTEDSINAKYDAELAALNENVNKHTQPLKSVTEKGNFKVTYDENGIKFTNKEGKEASAPTRRKYISEIANETNFHTGTEVTIPEDANLANEAEGDRYVIEHSDNPAEIAEVYMKQEKEATPLSNKESVIAESDLLGKIERKSIERFYDENSITKGMSDQYLAKEGTGQTIDQIAKSISDKSGKEITTEDIVNFMRDFPNGIGEATRLRENENSKYARQRFQELTGLPLTDEIAKLAYEDKNGKMLSDTEKRMEAAIDDWDKGIFDNTEDVLPDWVLNDINEITSKDEQGNTTEDTAIEPTAEKGTGEEVSDESGDRELEKIIKDTKSKLGDDFEKQFREESLNDNGETEEEYLQRKHCETD